MKLRFHCACSRGCDHTPPSGSTLLVVRASLLLREYYCFMGKLHILGELQGSKYMSVNKANDRILRRASSTVRNERTSECMLEEPTMKGSKFHPCEYSVLVFTDEVTVLIESGLVQHCKLISSNWFCISLLQVSLF